MVKRKKVDLGVKEWVVLSVRYPCALSGGGSRSQVGLGKGPTQLAGPSL